MGYEPGWHHRRSIRLRGYDYAQAGAYFITICTQNRECLFGEVVDGEMRWNDAGRMVAAEWAALVNRFPNIELDAFVVMPNHVHGIIVIRGPGATARVRATPVVAPAGAAMDATRVGATLVVAPDEYGATPVVAPDEYGATPVVAPDEYGTTTPGATPDAMRVRATPVVAPAGAAIDGAAPDGAAPDGAAMDATRVGATLVVAPNEYGATPVVAPNEHGATTPGATPDAVRVRATPVVAPNEHGATTPGATPDAVRVRATLVVAPNGATTNGATTRVAPTDGATTGGAVPVGATAGVAPTVGDIVGAFKSITTVGYIRGVKQFGWPPFAGRLWQRNYYEHIIRDEREWHRIRRYIAANPTRWPRDRENPRRAGKGSRDMDGIKRQTKGA